MAGLYVDTSALGRVLLAEPDAAAIRAAMGEYDADGWRQGPILRPGRRATV